VHAVAVKLARLKPRDVTVPYFVSEFRQRYAGYFLNSVRSEQTDFDPRRVCGIKRKVHASRVGVGTKIGRRPGLHAVSRSAQSNYP
jgi:hypothetical protein